MTDYLSCFTPDQDAQVDTGKGHVAGALVTSTSATSGACSLYDYAGAGPPDGPKILEVMVNSNAPLTLLFNDRYAPHFKDGLWLHSSAEVYVTLWFHIPTSP